MTITPGPNNIMILSSGLNFGIKKSLPHLLGIAFGFPIMLIAVGLGLDVLIAQSPIFHTIVTVLGVGYLLYLAFKLFTITKRSSIEGSSKPFTFFQVVLFQWVNSKAWVMIFSGLGTFATATDMQSITFIIALSFFIVIFPCNGLWLFLGSQMQTIIKNDTHFKLFNRTMAVLLIVSIVLVFI
jgi:threonine/homoserine/homoserine lactone efflux protein